MIISFHVPSDPFALLATVEVIVPTTNEFVVNVSGICAVPQAANRLGTNDKLVPVLSLNNILNQRSMPLKPVPFQFPVPGLTYAGNRPHVPFITPPAGNFLMRPEAGPWDWWSKPRWTPLFAFVNANFGTEFDANELHSNLLTNSRHVAGKSPAVYRYHYGILYPRRL